MENRFMNAKEASKFLGLPIMELYRLSSSSEIPSYKFGGKLLYRKDQLSQLLSQKEENELFDNQDLNKAAFYEYQNYNNMENTFLKVKEASELLRTSTSSIYKMTMNNTIPHYKVGRGLRFKKEELIRFVENGDAGKCTRIVPSAMEILRIPSLY